MAKPLYRVVDEGEFYGPIKENPALSKMHYGKGHKDVPNDRPGDEVEYDGLPGDNLIPLNAEAKAKAKEAAKIVAPPKVLTDEEREELQTLRDRRELETLRELDKLRALKSVA